MAFVETRHVLTSYLHHMTFQIYLKAYFTKYDIPWHGMHHVLSQYRQYRSAAQAATADAGQGSQCSLTSVFKHKSVLAFLHATM